MEPSPGSDKPRPALRHAFSSANTLSSSRKPGSFSLSLGSPTLASPTSSDQRARRMRLSSLGSVLSESPGKSTPRTGCRRGSLEPKASPRMGRDRRRTVSVPEHHSDATADVGITKLQQVLADSSPSTTDVGGEVLAGAPILGEELLQAFDESSASVLSSPLVAADKLEHMSENLHDKLEQMAREQSQRWFTRLSFAEPGLEASFRAVTFERRSSIYRKAALVLALVLAVLIVHDLYAFNGEYSESAAENKHHPEELVVALAMRGASVGLLLLYSLLTCYGTRNATLAFTVITFWVVIACYTVILECHSRTGGKQEENNMNALALIGAYVIFMPGMPFMLICCCGWGFVFITLGLHFVLLSWEGPIEAEEKLHVLWTNLSKIVLFNLFGMLGAYDQITQVRTNYWHAKLLNEALKLQKLVRERMHRLTSNTLPKAIVKAIGRGELDFVHTYQQCTVLQADMAGFTALSAKYPPQRVLGILSDIFEEFDQLCEEHAVDKIKTIGDAYIVCAGALDEPRPDDAERVVRMGMKMQDVVKKVREEQGLDIAVRIGVHTGRVTGGIIGKVRFQFDMWGNGVNGAVRMEETGEKFRVHVSDATFDLVSERFVCSVVTKEPEAAVADLEFSIMSSYMVECEHGADQLALGSSFDNIDDDKQPSGRTSAVFDWPRLRDVTKAPGEQITQRMLRWVNRSQPTDAAAGGTQRSSTVGKKSMESPPEPNYLVDEPPSPVGRDRADSNFFVGKSGQRPSLTPGQVPINPCRNSEVQNPRNSTAQQNPRNSQRPRQSARDKEEEAGTRNSRLSEAKTSGKIPARKTFGGPIPFGNSRGSSAKLEEVPSGLLRDDSEVEPPANPLPDGCLQPTGATSPRVDAQPTGAGLGRVVLNSPRGMAAAQVPAANRDGRPGPAPKLRSKQDKLFAASRRALDAALNTHSGAMRPPGATEAPQPTNLRKKSTDGALAPAPPVAEEEDPEQVLDPEEVLGGLRRSAMILTVVQIAYAFYDWLEWHAHPLVEVDFNAVMRVLLLRFAGALPISAIIALALSVVRHRGTLLMPSVMTSINVLLVILPFLCNLLGIWLAPDRNMEYMLCLALFHVWFGYTTIAVPPVLLVLILLAISPCFIGAELGCLKANPQMRYGYALEQEALLNVSLPEVDFSNAGNVHQVAIALGLSYPDEGSTTYLSACVYLIAAHILGILHNRKVRSNLYNHAKLLHEHAENMERISEEVQHCQGLLENIFPTEVLERLKQKNTPGKTTGVVAEEFNDCTFLFAKVVGLKQLTEDEERDPNDVIAVLQMIFDRFDGLADTFKVQKVRKTVNEYYMTAAGLPDPTLIESPRERALATAALAFSMVHIMDIINMELQALDIDVTLQAQIGINTGSAIAGVIGHKRFQYDLCGDAVNTAARMCAKSAPGCITVSAATYALLAADYDMLDRGEHKVKGKGEMQLYYLVGRTNKALQEQRLKAPEMAPAKAITVAKKSTVAIPGGARLSHTPPPPPPPDADGGLVQIAESTDSMHPPSSSGGSGLMQDAPSSHFGNPRRGSPKPPASAPSCITEEASSCRSCKTSIDTSSAPSPAESTASGLGAMTSLGAGDPCCSAWAAMQKGSTGDSSLTVSSVGISVGVDGGSRRGSVTPLQSQRCSAPTQGISRASLAALERTSQRNSSITRSPQSPDKVAQQPSMGMEQLFTALRSSPDPTARHLSNRGRGSSWAMPRSADSSFAQSESARDSGWTPQSVEQAAEAAALGEKIKGGTALARNSSSTPAEDLTRTLSRTSSYGRNYDSQRSWLMGKEAESVSRTTSFASSRPSETDATTAATAAERTNSLRSGMVKHLSIGGSAKRKSAEMWNGKSQVSTSV